MSLGLGGLREVVLTVAGVLAGFATLAGLGLWLLHAMRLAARAPSPEGRAEAQGGLWRVLVGLVIIYSAMTVVGIVMWLAGR